MLKSSQVLEVCIQSCRTLMYLLGEIDDFPLLVIELKVEAGVVSNAILSGRRGLGGEGSPRDCGFAQVRCDFGEHVQKLGSECFSD